jgi:hypothetical protein
MGSDGNRLMIAATPEYPNRPGESS